MYSTKQIEQTDNGPVHVQAFYHNICNDPAWSTHSQEEHRLMDYEAMGLFRSPSKESRDVLRGGVTAEFYPQSTGSNTPDSGSYRQTHDQSGGHLTLNQQRWDGRMAYDSHAVRAATVPYGETTLPIEHMSLEDTVPDAVTTLQLHEQLRLARAQLFHQQQKNFMRNEKTKESMWKQMEVVTKQKYEREVAMARDAGKREAFGELSDSMGLNQSIYEPVNLTTVKEKLEEKIKAEKFMMSDAEADNFARSNPIVRGIIVATVKQQVDLEMERIRAAEFETKLKIG